MLHPRVVLHLQAAMSPAKVISHHRYLTHPSVIPRHFGKGEGPSHFALIPQAIGAMMTLAPTRMDLMVAEHGQDPLEVDLAPDDL